jgi:coenzyme PQQ synthesis protein D (PqqD)
VGQGDVIGNLRDVSFTEAYQQLVRENERFHAQKIRHLSSGTFTDTDFFPCWYCSLYYKKVDWLKRFHSHPWSGLIEERFLDDEAPPTPAADLQEVTGAITEGGSVVLTMLSRATPHPDVLDTTLPNGEVVLLHLGTAQYYSLNETGSRIWHWMKEGQPLGAICEELEHRYDVTLDGARQCVLDLASQLVSEKLMQPAGDERLIAP